MNTPDRICDPAEVQINMSNAIDKWMGKVWKSIGGSRWGFDEIPANYFIKGYYDEFGWAYIPEEAGSIAVVTLADIAPNAIIVKYGFGICWDDPALIQPNHQEQFWQAVNNINITLKLNGVPVEGYAGKHFPISSLTTVSFNGGVPPQVGLDFYYFFNAIGSPANLVDMKYPVENNTVPTIEAMMIGFLPPPATWSFHVRLMAHYID